MKEWKHLTFEQRKVISNGNNKNGSKFEKLNYHAII